MAKDIRIPVTLRGNRLEAKAQLGQTVKVPGEGGAVNSVNGMTGDVVLTAEDVGAMPSDTPIPSVEGYATEEWVEEQGYLKEHQDLSAYALKSDIPIWHEKVLSAQDWDTNLGMFLIDAGEGKEIAEIVMYGQIVNDGTQTTNTRIDIGFGNSKTISRTYACPCETSAMSASVRRFSFAAHMETRSFTAPPHSLPNQTRDFKTAWPTAFKYGTNNATGNGFDSGVTMESNGVTRCNKMYWLDNDLRYAKIQSETFIPMWALIFVQYRTRDALLR